MQWEPVEGATNHPEFTKEVPPGKILSEGRRGCLREKEGRCFHAEE